VDERTTACVTIDYVFDQLQGAPPIYKVDNSTYYITEDIYVLDGITLAIKDKEVRLKSDAETFLNLRGHGGSILIEDSKITSWDPTTEKPDENVDDGRSYISCVSESLVSNLTCEGSAKNEMGEGRLDVIRSEVSHLGYYASESWGLSYKVRGFCSDKSNPEVMEMVGIYGDIVDSEIHDMWHGHYSFGHRSGNCSNNIIHDNIGYGFDFHDYSIDSLVNGNTVYNNGIHGIIGSKWCTGLNISNNVVYNSKVGVFSHVAGDHVIVENNEIYNNRDSGIVFLESSDSIVRNNRVYNNSVGTRISVGSRNLTYEGNVFENNGKYEVWTYEGTDTPTVLDSNTVKNIRFHNNVIVGIGMRFQDSESIQFVGNSLDLSDEIDVSETTQMLFLDSPIGSTVLDVGGESCFNTLSDVGDVFCQELEEVFPIASDSPVINSPTDSPVTISPTTSSPTTTSPTTSSPTTTSPMTSSPTGSPMSSPVGNGGTTVYDNRGNDGFGKKETWIVFSVICAICIICAVGFYYKCGPGKKRSANTCGPATSVV